MVDPNRALKISGMKNKTVLFVGLALLAGLLAGYFLFGENLDANSGQSTGAVTREEIWTCSMHPQIMQPEPGKCPICGMDLIPTGGDGMTNTSEFSMSERAMALADIRTLTVGELGAQPASGFTLSGEIMENQESTRVQSSYFTGRIEKLYINTVGDRVGVGQRLALLYAPELIAAQQELFSAATLKESQPALYEAVRNKLKLWKLSENQIRSIETEGGIQEYVPIQATVSGTITKKLVREGDYVREGQPLFEIANLNSVWAVFEAYETQLAALETGMEVEIGTNAFPGESVEGKISFINPVLDSGSRTVEVRVELPNRDGKWKPGMFVKAGIKSDNHVGSKGEVVLPASAVLWTGERSVVYVQTTDSMPVFEMREIQIAGTPSGDYVRVLNGLQPGDKVVVNGTFTVDAAAQLQGKKSMMNPEGETFGTGHEGHSGTGHESVPKTSPPDKGAAGHQETHALLQAYFRLKDALVSGEVAEVKAAAAEMDKEVREISAGGNTAKGKTWTQVGNSLKAIATGSQLAEQRKFFVTLNQDLVPLIKEHPVGDGKIFIQHCPMADDNQGAYWLSREAEIRNPYFGAAMLTCGSVTDTLN